MVLPLEIAVGLVAVSAALGALMIAIAGRFPPVPGQRGFSPFVTVGVVVVASIAVSAMATLLRLFRNKRADGRPSGGAE
jgi:hypothetical protein